MKIGVMLRSLDERKGPGTYTKNLLDALLHADQQNQYVLLYAHRRNLGRYAHRDNLVERAVAPGHTALGKDLGKLIWDQVAVPALVVREGLDIVFNPKFTVPLLASCKTMTVLHGTEWFIHPHFYPKLDVLYVKAMMPLYMRKADIVISVSNRARDDVITHAKADPRKVKTLYSAPDERFRRVPDAETLQAVKKRYGLPERFILNVGRIHPGKNVRTMLRVYGQLSSRIPHKLVMAGPVEGRYRNELGPIREYGLEEHVILPGWVPQEDMPALYRLAELFLFPSTYESCPIALLEAMASGCPVVSSSTGGTPEIAGDAALLIDPGDEDGMGRAVYEVLTKEPLRRELIRRGYEQSERFSWKRYAREMLTLFETLHAEG